MNIHSKMRGDLNGVMAIHRGCAFTPHPEKKFWSIQWMIFHSAQRQEWFIGLADVQGPGDLLAARLQLGQEQDLGEVAQYIQRSIQGTNDLEEIKKILWPTSNTIFWK